MSYLYVSEQGSSISFSGNRFHVKYRDDMVKSIPAETLEVIEVFGNVQITTPCMRECLKRGINIIFYSMHGAYFGRLISTSHVNVSRQRLQAELGRDEQFRIQLSKIIIDAKINNQMVLLRRYARTQSMNIQKQISDMQIMRNKIHNNTVDSIEMIMGYEGMAARTYFQTLGQLIDSDFFFSKRTRRPPLDPFNSLISLGYSIVMNEIYGRLEGKGLNPYFGFMHSDKEKHPTLASDLMEEWRAVIVDSVAMSLINGHELARDDFYTSIEEPGVFLDKKGFTVFVRKMETKLRTQTKYLNYIDYSVSFRRALDLQINQLVKAMEQRDASLYQPLMIR